MRVISSYEDFLLENEFSTILEEVFFLAESEGKWTGSNTYEWDFKKEDSKEKDYIDKIIDKLENFLQKIPKEKIKYYFDKFISTVSNLPSALRKKILIAASVAFLSFASLSSLLSTTDTVSNVESTPKIEQVRKEFKKVIQKSDFKEAQKLVAISEAGYSDDRKDTGNWIKVPGGKRFIGTKYGISAPVFQEYLGRLPKAEDMKNLSYETALKIYKADYWDAQNLQEFSDQNVANVLYDGCVNQGTEGTKQVLRDALRANGVKITDSENPFNKKRILEANSLDSKKLFDSIKDFRESRYREAATFKVHGNGWLARLDSINYQEA
jgi:lysozyme family protein